MVREQSIFSRFIDSFDFRIRQSIAWSVGGAVLSRVVVLISTILIVREIGQEDFGRWSLILSSILVAQGFFGHTLNKTIAKYVASLRLTNPGLLRRALYKVFILSFCIATILSVLLFFFSDNIASKILGDLRYAYVVRISTVPIFLGVFILVLQGVLLGNENFRFYGGGQFIGGVSIAVGTYIGALVDGVSGIVVAYSALSVLILFIYGYGVVTRFKLPMARVGTYTSNEASDVTKFIVIYWLSNVLVGPVTWLCTILLSSIDGGFKELAIYSVGDYWKIIAYYIPSMIINAVFPILAASYTQTETEQFSRYFKILFYGCICISGGMLLPVLMMSDLILGLYGEGFQGHEDVLIGMVLLSGVIALADLYRQVLLIRSETISLLFINILWAVIQLFGAFYFIENNGAMGLVYSLLLSYVVVTVLLFFLVKARLRESGIYV